MGFFVLAENSFRGITRAAAQLENIHRPARHIANAGFEKLPGTGNNAFNEPFIANGNAPPKRRITRSFIDGPHRFNYHPH
jgi:hypothetical protein